ncbi:MAG TPA: LysM peptidoglycan-binding domain-containing protein, partial [Kineobactrum sp.]
DTWAVTLPPLANAPAFVAVPTGGQIELARAAELADIELAHLQALNPGHRRWATAPAAVELLLPPESAVHFAQRLAALDANQRVNWQHYTIRSGDTLGAIARRFKTQVALLQAVNKLNGTFIRAGKSLMIPQGGDWAANLAQRNIKEPRETGYKVRRGDSLYRIAGLFKVSIDDIIAWNALNPRGHIYPGQQLTLYVGDG